MIIGSLLDYIGEEDRAGREISDVVESLVFAWWAENESPTPVYVGFSGGKDSSAVLAVAVNTIGGDNVTGWFWHIPGQTILDNIMASKRVAGKLGLEWRTITVREPRELWTLKPEPGTVYHVIVGRKPYWELLREKGTPAPPPYPRWCCKYYKEEPLANTRPQRPGRRYILTGVKRSDSRARAKRWPESCRKTFKSKHGVQDIALAPLCNLTDSEVWSLLKYYDIADIVKQQYIKYGRSPNCALCPLASKKQLKKAAKNLPRSMIEKYLEALQPHNSKIAVRMRKILEEEVAGYA